jgi:L-fuculose-phosphate aldolase
MRLAAEFETLCKQFALVLQIGNPRVLEAGKIGKTIEKFRKYGLRRKLRAA